MFHQVCVLQAFFLLVFGAVATGQPYALFPEAVQHLVGVGPWSVATGDLNEDGALDVVTANHFDGDDVAVLLGDGHGCFAPTVVFAAGRAPRSIALGDLDGDGHLDVVTANQASDDVSVLLGDGRGRLAAAVGFAAGHGPQWVTLGDVDRDGRLDVVVANAWSSNVSVLRGDGQGGLRPAVHYAVDEGPQSVALGHLNGDGALDLGVITAPAFMGIPKAHILLGDGTGRFSLASAAELGPFPDGVALGDLNRDGHPDAVVAMRWDGAVSVLLGNGHGGFAVPVNFEVGGADPRPRCVALADLDRDGTLDVLTANEGTDDVTVLLGDGNGGFQDPRRFLSGRDTRSIAVGDVDGDGHADAVATNYLGSTVSVLGGDGRGGLKACGYREVCYDGAERQIVDSYA